MDLKKHIGLRVRRARLKSGLTQEQLAERVDKTVETISNIERGRLLTGLETLERLGQCLDVPLRDFFESVEDRRAVSENRLELELSLLDFAKTLTEGELMIAVELAKALIKYRDGR